MSYLNKFLLIVSLAFVINGLETRLFAQKQIVHQIIPDSDILDLESVFTGRTDAGKTFLLCFISNEKKQLFLIKEIILDSLPNGFKVSSIKTFSNTKNKAKFIYPHDVASNFCYQGNQYLLLITNDSSFVRYSYQREARAINYKLYKLDFDQNKYEETPILKSKTVVNNVQYIDTSSPRFSSTLASPDVIKLPSLVNFWKDVEPSGLVGYGERVYFSSETGKFSILRTCVLSEGRYDGAMKIALSNHSISKESELNINYYDFGGYSDSRRAIGFNIDYIASGVVKVSFVTCSPNDDTKCNQFKLVANLNGGSSKISQKSVLLWPKLKLGTSVKEVYDFENSTLYFGSLAAPYASPFSPEDLEYVNFFEILDKDSTHCFVSNLYSFDSLLKDSSFPLKKLYLYRKVLNYKGNVYLYFDGLRAKHKEDNNFYSLVLKFKRQQDSSKGFRFERKAIFKAQPGAFIFVNTKGEINVIEHNNYGLTNRDKPNNVTDKSAKVAVTLLDESLNMIYYSKSNIPMGNSRHFFPLIQLGGNKFILPLKTSNETYSLSWLEY